MPILARSIPAPPAPTDDLPARRAPRQTAFLRLRLGSELTTRHGTVFRVRDAVVLVSNGAESRSVVVERTRAGQITQLVLTVGILANQARGALHKPGDGPLIDWSSVPRRPHSDVRRPGVYQPLVIGRALRER